MIIYNKEEHLFIGGPNHGQKVECHISPRKNYVYRSSIISDLTIYHHKGLDFNRYYKFFNHWRWEELDTFRIIN